MRNIAQTNQSNDVNGLEQNIWSKIKIEDEDITEKSMSNHSSHMNPKEPPSITEATRVNQCGVGWGYSTTSAQLIGEFSPFPNDEEIKSPSSPNILHEVFIDSPASPEGPAAETPQNT